MFQRSNLGASGCFGRVPLEVLRQMAVLEGFGGSVGGFK